MESERVRAWALVDDDGRIIPAMCFGSKEAADYAVFCLAEGEIPAGRIIPVEIRPLPEDER